MSETFDIKALLKRTKLNPVQKMGLTSRFKERAFPAPAESDNVYEVAFGQNIIYIRAAEGGLVPDEMDTVADVLQRARKNEQKAMLDMLVVIQVFPLAPDTVATLIEEWKENGVESKLVGGPALAAATE
ncbi:hypothetical protein JJB07_07915 [Tumebacillus sp. ITR2]|uniref:Tail assembly chaperone n=1 Tax=Tumebacillus amylolyticus TaxID=2801339 RepID=A0ABS1J8H3_9BACL|nr:hypothetical protein [Tumebacillus amylolyticus]MBL0386573.1 hypothetical protein [Tumebacillus amylolyticus]